MLLVYLITTFFTTSKELPLLNTSYSLLDTHVCYRRQHCGWCAVTPFKGKLDNAGRLKTSYKATVKCRQLIFWLQSQSRVRYDTAKPEPNRRRSTSRLPLTVPTQYECFLKSNPIGCSAFRVELQLPFLLPSVGAKMYERTEISSPECKTWKLVSRFILLQ